MRKRKYLIGALLGVIGSVLVVGAASATVTGQSVSSIINPAKAGRRRRSSRCKSMKTTVDTDVQRRAFAPNGTQTVVDVQQGRQVHAWEHRPVQPEHDRDCAGGHGGRHLWRQPGR